MRAAVDASSSSPAFATQRLYFGATIDDDDIFDLPSEATTLASASPPATSMMHITSGLTN